MVNANFAYHTAETEKFRNDYYAIVDTDIPLVFIEEELLLLMEKSGRPQFRVPKSKSKDKIEHMFYFRVKRTRTSGSTYNIYYYLKYD